MIKISSKARSLFGLWLVATLLSACGGGGSGTTTPPVSVTPPPPVASALSLSASATSVKSDNSNTATITATALTASNAALSGVAVTFSADTGILSAGSVTTDAAGKAQVTFSSGTTNASSRIATITATAGTITSQIPIKITGSTISLSSNANTLIVGGAATTLTATVRNAGGVPIAGTNITLTSTGSGSVTVNPASGKTDANGQFSSTVSGSVAGTVTVTATAAGETATTAYTISGSASAFAITSPSSSVVAATIGTPLTITVQAPSPAASVVFVTTLGTWDATGQNVVTKSVSGGIVSASLMSLAAGVATVQIYDAAHPGSTATITVTFTAPVANAARITLQAIPTIVAPSSGGNAGIASLIATVTDASGNPVGGASVAFQIITPTGGGETISPPVAQTALVAGAGVTLGQAKTLFTAGSLPSGASGVKVRASVVGSGIATGTSPSGGDAAITIGGTAGSVTIGRATVAMENSNATAYILPMSVLVADSNGNPVANATVSLSAWPIAFNNGISCTPATDYFNEDVNENLVLDPGEDGVRRRYQDGVLVPGGTVDGKLTPPNSAAGTLPATVMTDTTGLATFNLTYTKSNSIWITSRIRASTLVQGTETVGQTSFRLPPLLKDVNPICLIPDSPYLF